MTGSEIGEAVVWRVFSMNRYHKDESKAMASTSMAKLLLSLSYISNLFNF